jgi:hypothetical protein
MAGKIQPRISEKIITPRTLCMKGGSLKQRARAKNHTPISASGQPKNNAHCNGFSVTMRRQEMCRRIAGKFGKQDYRRSLRLLFMNSGLQVYWPRAQWLFLSPFSKNRKFN